MDFSKVRLADFAQARLRDVAGSEGVHQKLSSPSRSFVENNASDVCAHAPQYSVTLTPLVKEAVANPDELRDVQLDPSSGYLLAVTSEGVLVWRQGADSSVLFPLPETHSVSAILVPSAQDRSSVQPGLAAVDCASGNVIYWESINRAVGSNANNFNGASSNGAAIFRSETSKVPLGRREFIEIVEPVHPFGLVACTNQGHLYLVNLRDELGKRNVSVSEMRAGSGILARLRSMGAFARDISSVRAGRFLNEEAQRELYTVNRYGDVAVWHIGLNKYAELVNEIKMGERLCAQMNLLYPNCEVSLQVHDIAIEQQYNHILASFAPQHNSSLRYFVVMTTNADFDVVSLRRLRAYESPSGTISANTSLHTGSGVLVIACADAVALLDSPSRLPTASSELTTDSISTMTGAPGFRWEESVSLKQGARLLDSQASDSNGSVYIATSMGVLHFEFPHDRVQESTTKARLEQAVFESSRYNPLDLTRWSSFEAFPDSNAPQELALEIANSQTPFVPAQLPNLGEHLELRAQKLQKLVEQAPLETVKEIAQTVVASAAAYACYESEDRIGEEIRGLVDSSIQSSKLSGNFRRILVNNIQAVPEILASVASKPLTTGNANLILSVLQACDSSQLGIPNWASHGTLRQALEALTSQAADARDTDLLPQTTEILCAVYSAASASDAELGVRGTTGADCSTIRNLLQELSQLEGKSSLAMDIAKKYHVYSALAPLEVTIWLADFDADTSQVSSDSAGLQTVSNHIEEFGESYATAVFDSCVSSGHSDALVKQLAPRHFNLVCEYLKSRKLYSIAWTLSPGTKESTDLLASAANDSKSLDERRIYASLYKLSAYSTHSGNIAEAQTQLDLVTAQESLARQFQHSTGGSELFASGSTILKHGLPQLSKLIDRESAVDLLALAPPQAVPEHNDNFILGFKLVDVRDIVRQRLLVQQLVCSTNWDRIDSSPRPLRSKRVKQTLFYHTLQHVQPGYAAQLQNFKSLLIVSGPVEIKRSYPWDMSGSVADELASIAQRAASIADKYKVSDIVLEMVSADERMEID